MKKKILIGFALTFIVAVAGWNIIWSLEHDNTLSVALHNLVAIAGDENNQGKDEDVDIKELYKKNHMNVPDECIGTEVYRCEVGFTIPEWIPKIGGLKCTWTYVDEVDFEGMHNPCRFTGNPANVCDYYRCTRNR